MKNTFKILLIITIIIVLALSMFALSGCNTENTETKDIVVSMPDGAPALALAKLMSETDSIGDYNISYSIKDGTSIKSVVMSGEADIALLPMNMAAALYNGGIDIKLVSANIYGLLYLVGSESLENGLESLVGEVVYNVGLGGTPDFTFKKILDANDIEYAESETEVEGKVALAYMTPSTLVPQLKTGIIKYAVLGEPQATIAVTGSNNEVLIDLQDEWKAVTQSEEKGFPQVGLVVKSSLLESDSEFVQAFLEKVSANADWIIDNAAAAGQIITDNEGTMPITLTQAVVEKCNIEYVSAEAAKSDIIDYLTVLMNFNAQSIGGKLPDADFYYSFQ